MKKVNKECDLGINFDDTFKAYNNILSVVSRANRMIISNVVLRIQNIVLRTGILYQDMEIRV